VTTRIAPLALLLIACSGSDAATAGTCERRDECGNLEGLTVAECEAAEQMRLDRLGGDARSTCEAAISACLDGETCDDFRECQANLDRTVCPCPDPTLTIVDPVDGQTLGPDDDVEPGGMVDYDFVIDSVCLEDLEQVELFLLEPAMSSYGFGAPDGSGRAIIRVPLLPGTNRFVARGMTTAVSSAEVSVTVSP